MEAHPDRRPVRVVVIDDMPLARQAIAELLGRTFEAVEVVAVGEPEAALDLRATDPDLMIINGLMPRVTGPEVISRVRAFEAVTGRGRLPVIIESMREHYLEAGMRAGADASVRRSSDPRA